MNEPEPPLLSVRELRVAYAIRRGWWGKIVRRTVLDGVSFDLAAGESLGIVGASGSGKTTLARAILRFVPHEGGRVLWQGRDMAGRPEPDVRAFRRQAPMVFQDPVGALDPRMTVGTSVGEPLLALPSAERRARVNAILADCGLPEEMARRFPRQLSGGEAQRVTLARALISDPRLVICDEPTSALDAVTQEWIIGKLLARQRQSGLSLIIVSHDRRVVQALCPRVLMLPNPAILSSD
ncbi:MAG TPA: dipeptide/oligopeptide/nickel ABC transporter ATP-binding protein [Azospirillaceae bacterium]|nr:dipeptide/oligopeptide/nickel ABC transporter ATP-binding protein [Azospirillaceae bacterium]